MANLFWEDSVSVNGLHAGMYGYGGYWNGMFANMNAIKRRFPGKPVMGYATRAAGMQGADAIDAEPGTVGTTFSQCAPVVLAFVRAWKGGTGLFNKPLVYCFASWLTAMENYLAGHGVPRSAYYVNSSHATGTAHYCGPGNCGYGLTVADMTQYLFGGTYDRSVMQSYMLVGSGDKPGTVTGGSPAKDDDGMTVRSGDYGKAVTHVQQRLYNLKYLAGVKSADGQFGPATEAAVRAFQKAAGFTGRDVDGVVGPKTWAALPKNVVNPAYKPPKPVPPKPARPPLPSALLKPGARGSDVRNLQWYLRNTGIKGVRGIGVDGDYGDQTETAVRNFQGWARLPADGVYGPKTRAALANVRIA